MYRVFITISAPTDSRAKEVAEELEAELLGQWMDGWQDVALLSRIEHVPTPTSVEQQEPDYTDERP